MAEMQLAGRDTAYDNATNFDFPNNPNVVNSQLVPNRTFKKVPYSMKHIVSDGGGVDPKEIILNGTLYGTNRRTDFNKIAKRIHDQAVQRFYIDDDKFYYWMGGNIRETVSGDKPQFIDYVASLWTPIPFCHDTTLNTYTVTDIGGTETELNDATANSTGAFSNDGNAPSFVKWVFANQAGAHNVTQIKIGDASTIATSDHYITWSDSTGLVAGQTLTIYVFKLKSETSNFKFLRYAYPERSSLEFGSRSTTGREMPYVKAGESDQSFCVDIDAAGATINTDITATWYDAYMS